MRRIKKYNNFLINESFVNSGEYSDFLKEYSLPKDFFLDNLLEVNDIQNCNITFPKMIADEKGLFIKEFDENKEYRIKYMVLIVYKLKKDYDFDGFSKKIDEMETIRMSIQEMIDRCVDKGLTLDHNKVMIEGIPRTSPLDESSHTTFYIHFLSDVINDKLKSYYQKWNKDIGNQYHEMMKQLKGFYKTYGIDFDKFYDTNDTEDHIQIGMFPPGDADLHHVATYYKKENRYDIEHDTLMDSLHDFDDFSLPG